MRRSFVPFSHRMAVLERYNYGPVFTLPSLEKPTILMPAIAGGATWAGAACDPETGILYVPSITLPFAVTMAKSPVPHADYAGAPAPVETMQGIPLWKPPYGRITVTKTLLIVGQEGNTQRERSAQREASAEPGSVKVPEFEIHDPKLYACDKATGKVVGEVALPRNATGAPMTYMLNGRQFIVVATGGANLPAELIALCLP
jgi:quinoprotein glucose dehydrogenase